jgi:hypothetical protein
MKLMAVQEALESIEYNLHADKPGNGLASSANRAAGINSHEENSVGKPGEGINLPIAIGKPRIRVPFTHDSRS